MFLLLWLHQQVALIGQFLDSDNATLPGFGVAINLEGFVKNSRHVGYRVAAGEETHAAAGQAVDAAAVAVSFEQQAQARAESNYLDIGLILPVSLQNIAGNVQYERLLGRVHVTDLQNKFVLGEWFFLLSEQRT